MKTDEEREKAMQEAVAEIRRFLREEASYAELMKSAALAQARIIDNMRFVDEDEMGTILWEDISGFFYWGVKALSLLQPFEDCD